MIWICFSIDESSVPCSYGVIILICFAMVLWLLDRCYTVWYAFLSSWLSDVFQTSLSGQGRGFDIDQGADALVSRPKRTTPEAVIFYPSKVFLVLHQMAYLSKVS